MNLENILFLKKFNLPVQKPKDLTFIQFLEKKFNDYIKIIEDSRNLYQGMKYYLLPKDEFIKKIKKSCEEIIKIIRKHNEGKPDEAYLLFVNFISDLTPFFLTQANSIETMYKHGSFFRAKTAEVKRNKIVLKKRDRFFHTPFELSSKVGSARFSFPGFPTVYLSNGLIVAYHEVRSKTLKTFQATKFMPRTNINLLNFEFENPVRSLKSVNPIEFDKKIFNKALLYPLLVSCFTVNNSKDVAPPEYYIPQLLNRWLRDFPDLNGIKYTSTQILNNKNKIKFYNIILPTRTPVTTGFCPYLKDLLYQSEVCSWHHHKTDIIKYYNSHFKKNQPINDEIIKIQWPIGKQSINYEFTTIGKMEFYLKNLPCTEI